MSCLSDGDPLQNSTYAHWKNGAPASYIFEKLQKYTYCTCKLLQFPTEINKLMVPRFRLKLRGDCEFSIAGPQLCNSLMVSLRLVSSESEFNSKLKTYLFTQAVP